jgi:hypothetical protein
MTDEDLQHLTEQRDKASGEERTRLEREVRAASARRAFQRQKKERQRREAQKKLDDAVAPRPWVITDVFLRASGLADGSSFDGALYSATGRRAEVGQKTEFEGWSVLPDGLGGEGGEVSTGTKRGGDT